MKYLFEYLSHSGQKALGPKLDIRHNTVIFFFMFFPCCSFSDVDGKVIHLVERAPPQPTQSGGGGDAVPGSSGGGGEGSTSSAHSSTSTSQGAPHDRNGNSYVMLGTFNVPVNILDPQQIQVTTAGISVIFR